MQFWVVDVFAESLFEGNQAVVCWLDRDLAPAVLQKIAREFNVHETVFVSYLQNQHFQAQIFTPFSNESVCGHGLLAAAHVLWNELKPEGVDPNIIYFDTSSGIFMMSNQNNKVVLHTIAKTAEPAAAPDRLINALGTPPIAVSKCGQIYVVEMFNPKHVLKLEPDIAKLEKIPCNGVVVTAEGGNDVKYDFMSRFFAPREGFKEDPITLWNHCFLGYYWTQRLQKNSFIAMQTSASGRGGMLEVECLNEQVKISGKCISSIKGQVCGLSNWSFSHDLFETLKV